MGRKVKDLTGQTFGLLQVVCRVPSDGRVRWSCVCQCGREKEVSSCNLSSGSVTSCGTCRNSNIFVGDIYGKWTVIAYTGVRYTSSGGHYTLWRCECACGNIHDVTSDSLLQGKSTGCRSCSHITHGQYREDPKAYQRNQYIKYREKSIEADYEWSPEKRKAILRFQPYCAVCGSTKRLEVDHVLPLVGGNGLRPGNAAVLCRSCNAKKSGKELAALPSDWRDKILASAEAFRVYWEENHEIPS